ncbi:MAG TPA: VOC family protein [Ktedonobacteraceae bacterium]|nr:VOC family protein [Ktedonobacteraceae bacterium]
MFTSLDHIIIGVRNLDAAAALFGEKLGLVPSGGGIHPVGGTANRIVVIGDTYLELITIYKPDEAQESLRQRLEKGEGYLNFVLSSSDIEADSQALRQRGMKLIGPTPGSLQAADGRSRSWTRVDIERPDLTQRYPFLIQHDSSGEERRRRLAGWSTPPGHPLGAIKVHSVTLAVEDLAEAGRRYAHIYGLQPSAPFSAASQGLGAQVVSFSLGQSGQAFELATPSLEEKGPSALRDHLERFGESLYRMTLQVSDLARSRRYLDERGVPYVEISSAQPLLWIDASSSCGAPIVLQERD